LELTYPRPPSSIAREIAASLIKRRYIATYRDLNALQLKLRDLGVSFDHAYCGPSSEQAVPVVSVLADENLTLATDKAIEKRLGQINLKIQTSISHSVSRFNPARLGGSGAAGRQRDQTRAGEARNIMRIEMHRLQDELNRRRHKPVGGHGQESQ